MTDTKETGGVSRSEAVRRNLEIFSKLKRKTSAALGVLGRKL